MTEAAVGEKRPRDETSGAVAASTDNAQLALFSADEIERLARARERLAAESAAKRAADQAAIDDIGVRLRELAFAVAGVGLRERTAEIDAMRRAADLGGTAAIGRLVAATVDEIAPSPSAEAIGAARRRRASRDAIARAATSTDSLRLAPPALGGTYAVGESGAWYEVGDYDELSDLDAFADTDQELLAAADLAERRRNEARAYLAAALTAPRQPFLYDRETAAALVATLRAAAAAIEWNDSILRK